MAGAGWVATAWVEGVGAMGVAGSLEDVEVGVELVENKISFPYGKYTHVS